MAYINTTLGTFEIIDNQHNGTILLKYGQKVNEFYKTPWWNLDELLLQIEKSQEEIKENLKLISSPYSNINQETKQQEQITKPTLKKKPKTNKHKNLQKLYS